MTIVGLLTIKRYVSLTSGCWLYTGALDKDGYGKIKYKGKTYRVHRLAWTAWIGPIKEQILHKPICLNKHCFNPEHLYDGTHNDNMKDRKDTGTYVNYDQFETHCIRGHKFDVDNTYINKTSGARQCKACRKERARMKGGWRA